MASFRMGLKQQGYVDVKRRDRISRNATIRQATGSCGRAGWAQSGRDFCDCQRKFARAAIATSQTIPIVFAIGTDPVRTRLVASMNRPGGNATGITYYSGALVAKRLELIREILRPHMTIGFMTNPTNIISEGSLDDIRAASATMGQRLIVLYASSENEISAASATAHRQGVSALLVDVDTTFNRRREQVVGLADSIRYRRATRRANLCIAAA